MPGPGSRERMSMKKWSGLASVIAALAIATVTGCSADKPGRTDATTHPVPPPPAPTVDTADIVVAPDGADDAAGTAAAPLRTIDAAAGRAVPGTTVLVRTGTYEGDVDTEVSGTEAARISFIAESPGTRIVGDGAATGAWENDGEYVDIVGFDVSGANEDGIWNRGSHVRIMQNRVYGFRTGNCILAANEDYDLTDVDVIGNIAHGCGDNELDHGIYVSHARGMVANNIAYGNPGFGIHCWHACNDLMIANNLVFDNAEGGILVAADNDDDVPADNFVVSNNIAVGNGREGIREGGETGSNNQYFKNLLWGNGDNTIRLNTGWQTGTIVADPQFVDYRADGSGDYRLQPSSPAIDAGIATVAPSVAINGSARPLSRGVDLGPYER
jgi:Right handed beta helix region